MNLTIDKKSVVVTRTDVDCDILVNKIRMGKAILFTGAGFSFGSKNTLGDEPLGAKDLSHKLSEKSKIPYNEDLMFTSDYFLSQNTPTDLIKILKDNYTLTSTSETQNTICSLPWRRVYTTNYDLSVEIASNTSGRRVDTIDIHHSYGEVSQPKTCLCVHLNGSINALDSETLNTSFKLSASSYVSSESFLSSGWHYGFKKDLERANAIIFVGYSLYDIDIQKILYEDESLKEKTYFVTIQAPDVQTEFTLSKFGTVLPIGTDGFARFINDNQSEDVCDSDYQLQTMSNYEISTQRADIRDSDVEKLLMYGDISQKSIDSYVLGDINVPYLINRTYVDKTLDAIRKDKNVIFYGALGNGKSLLLNELKVEMGRRDFNIYNVDDIDGDYVGDIEYLSSLPSRSLLFLDDYEQYMPVIEHISRSNINKVTVIASARIADHEYLRDKLLQFSFYFEEFNIDTLDEDELSNLIKIFENLGYWADKATTPVEKLRYIKRKNESQVSLSLIDFLDSPVIKAKIKELFGKLETNSDFKSTILAICLCKVIGVPSSKSLISEVAGNDSIYSGELTSLPEFKQLFRIYDGVVQNTSSIFCICLMNEHYTASHVTEHLIRIATKFDGIAPRDHIQERVFKSMLKFSFVERILPSTTKVGNLQRYYEDLKVNIPWLRTNPHFWLQYAMTFIAFKNYPKAQNCLDQAYDLAEKKTDYYTDNIDTQQARLWLTVCSTINDGNVVYAKFEKAHNLLHHLGNDIYKFRQVGRYSEFYNDNFNKLSKSNKQNFIHACKSMVKLIDKLQSEEHTEHLYLEKTKNRLQSITILGI
ncbi:SIR2 family protein [Vibrio sp. TH_r3]|uniref:SIR2 family protein n=1 Tax=Vibrio sp. TH_r3 TaxID=3082084 RepID=UPI0029543193|nr:SIR2 family protein [Vibrio sp. TH_r3]MDV7106164.1 SIR2 family protein [Vibrio sp. TH_r3]